MKHNMKIVVPQFKFRECCKCHQHWKFTEMFKITFSFYWYNSVETSVYYGCDKCFNLKEPISFIGYTTNLEKEKSHI